MATESPKACWMHVIKRMRGREETAKERKPNKYIKSNDWQEWDGFTLERDRRRHSRGENLPPRPA